MNSNSLVDKAQMVMNLAKGKSIEGSEQSALDSKGKKGNWDWGGPCEDRVKKSI